MKETGIIRRIDELGRIVLPKEIRNRLNIINGDALDIYTDKECIILRKYQHIDNNLFPMESIFKSIKDFYGGDYVLFTKERIMLSTISDLELNLTLVKRIDDYLDFEFSNKLFNTSKSFYVKRLDDDNSYIAVIDNLITKQKKDLLEIIYRYGNIYFQLNS